MLCLVYVNIFSSGMRITCLLLQGITSRRDVSDSNKAPISKNSSVTLTKHSFSSREMLQLQ